GPGAGAGGGEVVFHGTYADMTAAGTPTARALARRRPANARSRRAAGVLTVRDATRNNLRHLTLDIPRGVLTVLSGVAGSGKSTLAAERTDQHEATVVDQRPVSANRRSTPITYTGIATAIRKLFAARNGVATPLFSANSEGGCPACDGRGVIYTDLAFMEGHAVTCETRGGRRCQPEVLGYTLDGLTIAGVDGLTSDAAGERLPAR